MLYYGTENTVRRCCPKGPPFTNVSPPPPYSRGDRSRVGPLRATLSSGWAAPTSSRGPRHLAQCSILLYLLHCPHVHKPSVATSFHCRAEILLRARLSKAWTYPTALAAPPQSHHSLVGLVAHPPPTDHLHSPLVSFLHACPSPRTPSPVCSNHIFQRQLKSRLPHEAF